MALKRIHSSRSSTDIFENLYQHFKFAKYFRFCNVKLVYNITAQKNIACHKLTYDSDICTLSFDD